MFLFSMWHLLILLIFAGGWLLPIIPAWIILRRIGALPPLAILWIMPMAPLIGLFVMAFSRWPGAAGSPAENP